MLAFCLASCSMQLLSDFPGSSLFKVSCNITSVRNATLHGLNDRTYTVALSILIIRTLLQYSMLCDQLI